MDLCASGKHSAGHNKKVCLSLHLLFLSFISNLKLHAVSLVFVIQFYEEITMKSSSPKLEDLFSGINGYPHQNTEQQTLQREVMFSGLASQEMFQQPLGEELVAEAGISSLKNLATQGLGYEDLHYLSLSMNPGPQSSYSIASQYLSPPASVPQFMALNSTKKRGTGKGVQKQPVHRKTIDSFGQRTSQYRGVTR